MEHSGERENLHKFQQAVTQTYSAGLEQTKNIKDRNCEDKKFKLVIFGDTTAKLIVPKNTIKCDELVTSHKVVRK